MINLTRGATAPETVVLTLNENLECIGPSASAFVFLLTSDYTGATAVFTAPEVANNSRFNSFEWQILGSTAGEDTQEGKIYLKDLGSYSYVAYQFYASTPQDLDLSNAIKAVEVGRMTLREAQASISEFSTGATTTPNYS